MPLVKLLLCRGFFIVIGEVRRGKGKSVHTHEIEYFTPVVPSFSPATGQKD
jgi:hypothetical protein